MSNVTDIQSPTVKVGKFYMVPVVDAQFFCGAYAVLTWPIRGIWHEDADIIDFKSQHYHLDVRFLGDEHKQILDLENVPPIYGRNPYATVLTEEMIIPSTLRMARRKCRRPEIGFPRKRAPWIPALQKKYRGQSLKDTKMKCPHKGYDLTSQVPTNGCLTCPLHGLKFTKAGKVAAR